MCGPGQQPGAAGGAPAACQSSAPLSARDAVAMVLAGLSWLAGADMTGVPARVAADGADLPDLANLFEQIRHRLAKPDTDPGGGQDDDGPADRYLHLGTTLGGAGRVDGNLTPRCAAALQAVLDALGKKAGPEDIRTLRQRQHDAVEEACRRLIASGGLPDRAGQPTQIQLHISLDDLPPRMGAGSQEPGASDPDRPVLPAPAAMPGDATDRPIV